MSLNSKRLLHYSQQLRIDSETYPKGLETGWYVGHRSSDETSFLGSSLLVHNPAALRDTLLVAGMHYIMRTRDVKTFDSTFLFHKIEIIRQINERLVNQHTERFIDLTRRKTTMCLVEIALGNHVTAETHFEGLVTLLCTYQLANISLGTQVTLNEELMYWYFILTCNIIHLVRSRMAETARDLQMMGLPEPKYLGPSLVVEMESVVPMDFGKMASEQKHQVQKSPMQTGWSRTGRL
ncbi:hypothetical protein V2G26_007096 [Clonostachys chloroleuca]